MQLKVGRLLKAFVFILAGTGPIKNRCQSRGYSDNVIRFLPFDLYPNRMAYTFLRAKLPGSGGRNRCWWDAFDCSLPGPRWHIVSVPNPLRSPPSSSFSARGKCKRKAVKSRCRRRVQAEWVMWQQFFMRLQLTASTAHCTYSGDWLGIEVQMERGKSRSTGKPGGNCWFRF